MDKLKSHLLIFLQSVWDTQHEDGAYKLAAVISSLKGFYIKTAQIISSRGDLFPKQYTEALSDFTDNVDPMETSLVKAIIQQELLNRGEKFEDVFSEFDEEPLGAASIAQVHRAVLTEKYGGPREVAIKCQRPSIESKLMGDISNLKAISKAFRNLDALPLDYYTVFAELEKSLGDEFDFVAEAVAMDRIYNAISRDMQGNPVDPPLVMPRPIPGLVCRRVLVMDYLKGVPLSR
jgi:aarF domain-containing kinase